ncbi:MAG: hypothetical protein ACTSUE_06785 [Promethearchaeota archaeon]
MGERNLEDFLSRLNKDDDSERMVILQGIVEKMLNYLLSTIQTTETRISDIQMGILNVNQYLNRQLSDLTGRLRQLPSLEDLKPPEMPQVRFKSTSGQGQFLYQELKKFIEMKVHELLTSAPESDEPGEIAEVPSSEGIRMFVDDDFNDLLNAKEKELLEKETYLAKLADQLSEKEVALQDREKSIEIIENGLADKLKITAALDMIDIPQDGEANDPEDDLEDLSQISESILQGTSIDDSIDDMVDDDLDEDEMVKKILEGDE